MTAIHENYPVDPFKFLAWLREQDCRTLKNPMYGFMEFETCDLIVTQRTITTDSGKYWHPHWAQDFMRMSHLQPHTVDQHIHDLERIIQSVPNLRKRQQEHIHGELIAEFKTPKATGTAQGAYVLRRRDDAHHPYTVHWRNDESGGYCFGGYHETPREATEDFARRIWDWTINNPERGD